jgi:sec-independent protein translocase protein TatA
MFGNLNGWHLLILLAVILLLFGAAKLPALAKSVGQSARVFRGEMKAMKEEEGDKPAVADGTAASTATETSAPAVAPPKAADTADPKP